MSKAYIWKYKDLEVTTELVKNGVWRWYSSAYRYNAGKTEAERTFIQSGGSNAITHIGAIKEFKRELL